MNPQNQQNSLRRLYETGSSVFDLGDYDTFQEKMKKPESRQKFYSSLSQHYDLGDYKSFEGKVLGLLPSESPQQQYDDTWSGTGKRMLQGVASAAAAIPRGLNVGMAAIDVPISKISEAVGIKGERERGEKAYKYWAEKGKEVDKYLQGKLTERFGEIKPASPEQIGFEGLKPFEDPLGTANKLAKIFVENAPTTAMLGIGTMVNPVFGTAMLFGVEAGDAEQAFDELEAKGIKIDPSYRKAAATSVGALNAMLERVGFDQIFKSTKVPGLKSKLFQALIASTTEGATEALQEVNQIIAETGTQLSEDDLKTMRSTFEKIAGNIFENKKRVEEAGLGGAVVGGGISALSSGGIIKAKPAEPPKPKEEAKPAEPQAPPEPEIPKDLQDQLEKVSQELYQKKFSELGEEQQFAIAEELTKARAAANEKKFKEAVKRAVTPEEQKAKPAKEAEQQFDAVSQEVYGKPFANITEEQQARITEEFDKAQKAEQDRKLKEVVRKTVAPKQPEVEKPKEETKAEPAVEKPVEQPAAEAEVEVKPEEPAKEEKPPTAEEFKKAQAIFDKAVAKANEQRIAEQGTPKVGDKVKVKGRNTQYEVIGISESGNIRLRGPKKETFAVKPSKIDVGVKGGQALIDLQKQFVRAELEKAGISKTIIDELAEPRRSPRPFTEEGDFRELTTRKGRIERAVEPPAQVKGKVDEISEAAVDFRNKEAEFEKAKADIIEEVKARGGEVVVDTETGAFTVKLQPGKTKMGISDTLALQKLRREAAEAGAYSLATVGRGFEIAAAPEKIADAVPLQGSFADKIKEFVRRNQAYKEAGKAFDKVKAAAHDDLVDAYLAERAAGREPQAFKGMSKAGVAVEVLTRRNRSAIEPDIEAEGRDFPKEVAQMKQEAAKRGVKGEPFLETRKAGAEKVARAEAAGTLIREQAAEYTPGQANAETLAPIWYSQMERVLEQKLPNSGTPESFLQTIEGFQKKGEFKKEEIEWIGLKEWLADQKGKVTKQQVLEFVRENNVQIKEVEKGTSSAVRRRIFALPSWGTAKNKVDKNGNIKIDVSFKNIGFGSLEILGKDVAQPSGNFKGKGKFKSTYNGKIIARGTTFNDVIDKTRQFLEKHLLTEASDNPGHTSSSIEGNYDYREILFINPNSVYEASHWKEKGVFAHARIAGRIIDNKNVLYIHEIQSDLHQGSRKKGYDATNNAPFKKTWHEFVIKRMIRYAAEREYDSVAFTNGDLATARAGEFISDKSGAFMHKFYDEIVPSFVKSYVKKWNGKIETQNLDIKPIFFEGKRLSLDVNIFDITPAMRDAVLTKGQALFEQQAPYVPNYKKRPDASFKTNQAASQAVNAIGNNRRRGRVLLANAINAEAREKGAVSLIGKEVRTSDDVAVLAQVYRDPRWETLRYIFVKNGKIVHVTGVSNRLPAATAVFPVANEKKGIAWLNDLMKSTKADGYYILHNHPSGKPNPSPEDINMTKSLLGKVNGFKGHVIIDSNNYTVLVHPGDIGKLAKTTSGELNIGYNDDNIVEIRRFRFFGEERLLAPSTHGQANESLGLPIRNMIDIAEVGKRFKKEKGWAVLISSSKVGVRGIMEVDENLLQDKKRTPALLRKFARQTGAPSVFAYVSDEFFHRNHPRMAKAITDGFVVDVVSESGYSALDVLYIPNKRAEFGIREFVGREVKEGSAIPDNITVDGKERSTRNSKGQLIHPTLEGIENFWKWFGDSKVVDEQGRPLVMYHGTNSSFEKFDKAKIGTTTDDGFLGKGFYFSTDPNVTRNKTVSMPTYLLSNNPAVEKLKKWEQDKKELFHGKVTSKHDSAILDYSPVGYNHKEIMVKEPTQIKSAIGNIGAFSPTEPSIVREDVSQYRNLIATAADKTQREQMAKDDEAVRKIEKCR